MEIERSPREDLTTRLIDVATDSQHGNDGANRADAVALHVKRQSQLNCRMPTRREKTRSFANLLGRNPGAFAQQVEVVLSAALNQRLESICPTIHKVVIVEIFVYDDLEHGDGNGRINGRARLNPNVGPRRKPRQPWINDDQLGAAPHYLHQPVAKKPIGARSHAIVTPTENDFRISIFGVVEAILVTLRAIRHHVVARADVVGNKTGHPASQPRRIALDMRRSHSVGQSLRLPQNIAPRPAKRLKCMGAIFLGKRSHFFIDQIESFIPCNLFPRIGVSPLRRIALHRAKQAIRAVHHVGQASAAGADVPLIERVLPIALHFLKNSILVDIAHDATAGMAPRSRPRRRPCYGIAVFFPSDWQIWSTHAISFPPSPQPNAPTKRLREA